MVRDRLTLQGGGFEAITDTWRRISAAADNTNYDQQTADTTKKTAENTEEIASAVRAAVDLLAQQRGGMGPEAEPSAGRD